MSVYDHSFWRIILKFNAQKTLAQLCDLLSQSFTHQSASPVTSSSQASLSRL